MVGTGGASPSPASARDPSGSSDVDEAYALLTDLAANATPPPDAAYLSPLLAAQQQSPPLTVADMDRLAATIQRASAATAALPTETRENERAILADHIRAGAHARDELVRRCERMVRFRASKEVARRRSWGSSIPLADLIQDGMVGLLKGAHSYQPGRSTRDPLAYLALWVVQEIRRSADKADQDWDISTEMVERFRRIKAIRSRLTDELGRAPTAEEIVKAADEPMYSQVGVFAGRHNTTADGAVSARAAAGRRWEKLSVRDVELEARHRGRIGAGRRLGSHDDEHPDLDNVARAIDPTLEPDDDVAKIVEQAAAVGLRSLLEDCLTRLDLPPLARQIIDALYGLHGTASGSQRAVSRQLNVAREVVADVAAWFEQAMNQPGGVFYRAAMALTAADRESLGLGWVDTVLAGPPADPPPLPPRVATAAPRQPRPPVASTSAVGVAAQYVCERDDSSFVVLYEPTDPPATALPCRVCGHPSPLTRSRLTTPVDFGLTPSAPSPHPTL